jgi:hypothetical protein
VIPFADQSLEQTLPGLRAGHLIRMHGSFPSNVECSPAAIGSRLRDLGSATMATKSTFSSVT